MRNFSATLLFDGTLFRFIAVGFTNFFVSFSVFWLCLTTPFSFSLKASLSQLLSYSCGIIWSFYWNRRVTFKTTGSIIKQASRFISLQVFLGIVSVVLIGYMVDFLDGPPTLTWVVVMTAITIANYLLSKFWVFKK